MESQHANAPRDHYRSAAARARSQAERLEAVMVRIGRFRVATFLVGAASFLSMDLVPREARAYLIGLGIVAVPAFLVLVRRYQRTQGAMRRSRLREAINREAEDRLDRSWGELPSAPVESAPPDHPSARDLDLVGRASLAQLIGRVCTAPGRALLRQLLLDPFAPLAPTAPELLPRDDARRPAPRSRPGPTWRAELEERHAAVRILASERELREAVELSAREAGALGRTEDTRRFLDWLEEPRWLAAHPLHRWAGRILALFTPLSLVTWAVAGTPGFLPILGGLASLTLHRIVGPRAAYGFGAAEAGEGDLRAWSAQLEVASRLPDGSAVLERLRRKVREPEPGAAAAIRGLIRIADTANARRSSLAHFPLVVLFSWDVLLLDLLERWHGSHAAAAAEWIRVLGELEALSALAGLFHDHPDWVFPEIGNDAAEGVDAVALGHPLLDPAKCIRNDVRIPPPGRILLVTGSNMAGKTTLLRALGTNQVLALAGAPVCARRLRTPAILPWCAMRVTDDLTEGVSYFLAELRRLKRVVDAAVEGPVLYLLDEILQGTNSAERRAAARIVLRKLLTTTAVGAVTSHDLELADTPDLRERAVDVHLREQVVEGEDGRSLVFDYLLRPGPATSRNALLLVEMVGLGPGNPETEHPPEPDPPIPGE